MGSAGAAESRSADGAGTRCSERGSLGEGCMERWLSGLQAPMSVSPCNVKRGHTEGSNMVS